MTIKDVYKQLGFHADNHGYYKKETSQPKLDFIVNFLKMFPDISAKWLVLGEGDMWEKNNVSAAEITNLEDYQKRIQELELLVSSQNDIINSLKNK